MSTTPTTIVAGFLGSGKTTIISHLIDELQSRGEQVAYIKNEIGDNDLDAKLMQGKNIKTKELLNGCICCTIVGPFNSAIDELIANVHPDRIIIEASGAADSAALALTISAHRSLRRDGVVAVIDVVNFEGYKDLSTTAQNQTKFTDLLIFNKVELVDLPRKRAVVGYVRELNNHSPIVEAPQGIVPAAVVFGIDEHDLQKMLEGYEASEVHDQLHSHEAADGITAFTLPIPGVYTEADFTSWLQTIPKNIIRSKGVVKITSSAGETARRVFNMVGSRVEYQDAPPSLQEVDSFIICIGVQATQSQEQIKQSLQSG